MAKYVICTVGASLLRHIGMDDVFVFGNARRDDVPAETRRQFDELLHIKLRECATPDERRRLSAELNTLDRLGVGEGDKVALLLSDSAPGVMAGEGIKRALSAWYGMPERNIISHVAEGLNANSAQAEFKGGLRDLVAYAMKLIQDNRYSHEIILNPLGGYKSSVPFLTVLGMLFGLRSVYIFEGSKQLMLLPPLPITLDYEMFERARPALKHIAEREDANAWVNRYEYLSRVADYADSEQDMFLSYVEPVDENNVTVSPLAFALMAVEEQAPEELRILPEVAAALRVNTDAGAAVIREMLNRAHSPLWRDSHLHSFSSTDLTVLKRPHSPERIAGFVKDSIFHVTHAFTSHDVYERELRGKRRADYADRGDYERYDGTGAV